MTKTVKFFLISSIVSLPFWWGINALEANLKDFLFWREIAENPQIFTAQVNQQRLDEELKKLRPLRDWNVEEPEITAKSAISVFIDYEGKKKVLFEKNSDLKLPIASLTKLMTAHVVLEHYELSEIISVSKEAVLQEMEFGKLKIGEIFKTGELFYPLLMESSNDAAFSLAADYKGINKEAFFDLMNLEAKNLSLGDTYFVNSTGLDPQNPKDITNYSTAKDLVKFTDYLLEKHPLIWEVLGTTEYDLFAADKVYHHKVLNNNELLWRSDGWRDKIIGGKTGWTLRAQGCLLLVLKAPRSQGYLINIILGSKDRFLEMEKLTDWVFSAFNW